MLLAGKGCAEIALAVGVARQTVYTWKHVLSEGGIDAPEPGRPAQMNAAQLVSVCAAIMQSPTAHGFAIELWMLRRVAAVIQRMHGVRFSQAQVWRILGSFGFSPQKPEKCVIERDVDAVRQWKRNTWLALKKKPREKKAG